MNNEQHVPSFFISLEAKTTETLLKDKLYWEDRIKALPHLTNQSAKKNIRYIYEELKRRNHE